MAGAQFLKRLKMDEAITSKSSDGGETAGSDLSAVSDARTPRFRRNLFPSNIVLSAEDLNEFSRLILEANERAKKIELASVDLSQFDSKEQAEQRANEVLLVEHNYTKKNGDFIEELSMPETDGSSFPEELKSFYISTSSYPRRAINIIPLNNVDAFFGFKKPSLKLDLLTFPSNPTENDCVINIYGRDEDWVMSTERRIEDFLAKKKVSRPLIHGSGSYDYFLYLLYLPVIILFYYKYGSDLFTEWTIRQPVFLNVILGIYAFLTSLLVGRFVFQYVRWLFPPIEYYKSSRRGAFVHRGVAALVGSAILLNAAYDLSKFVFKSLF